jgi:4-amino-4-deoxy-L-arabinose transferase-like glycosyltransferase
MKSISPLIRRATEKLASLGTIQKFIIIALIAFFVFALSKGPPPGQNHYVYLADAFLHGRLGVSDGGIYLQEIVPRNGNFYVVYPPMPAVLLMPFVAAFGTGFDESLLSIMLASLCVSLTWLMLKKIGSNTNKALWLTALLGFGTCLWFIASVGTSWYIAEVVAVLFLTSAILVALYKRSYVLVGLLLGFAALARLPVALAFPFFLFLIYERDNAWKPRIKQAALFFVGLAIPVSLYFLYNVARWGTVLDLGYGLIPGIQQDPFFQQGIFNIAYIPRQLYAIFLQGPIFLSNFPYIKPNWIGLALFFTTPAFLFIFNLKAQWHSKLSLYSAIAVLCILPPIITHGTVGFTQFGYRFSLDFTPFLMLLTAKGMRENLGWPEKALIILSLLVNLWGVVSIIKFDFVSF